MAFLGVLGGEFAVRINRQDAKSAKNFAKQNSFQESKIFSLLVQRIIRAISVISVPPWFKSAPPQIVLSVLISITGNGFAQETGQDLKSPELTAEGEQVFAKYCSIPYCHGKDGAAGRAPAVRDKRWEATALRKIILEGVPNTSMPNWNDKLSERQLRAVVGYILSIAGESPAKDTSAPPAAGAEKAEKSSEAQDSNLLPESIVGDPGRGEQLFFESTRDRGCAGCHAIDGKGNAVGPDLSGSSRKGAREIFRDIVYPDASVDTRQQLLRLTMKDGEKILGLKQEESPTSLRVFDLGGSPPVLRRLSKDRIQAVEPLRQSGMPARYGEIYTLRELLDLVSFLKSSGAPSPVKVTFLDVQ